MHLPFSCSGYRVYTLKKQGTNWFLLVSFSNKTCGFVNNATFKSYGGICCLFRFSLLLDELCMNKISIASLTTIAHMYVDLANAISFSDQT